MSETNRPIPLTASTSTDARTAMTQSALPRNPNDATPDDAATRAVWSDVAAACRRVPPLWDLPNYVAVNPYLGFSGRPVAEAARVIGDGLGARVLPGYDFYRSRRDAGAFGPDDVASAARRGGVPVGRLESALSGGEDGERYRDARPVATFAERYDAANGTDWRGAVLRSMARWCAVHAADREGASPWGVMNGGGEFFAAWREAESADLTMEVLGLRGWRDHVRRLPDRPDEAAALALSRLGVPEEGRVDHLYRLLCGLYGWASHFRRAAWSAGDADAGEAGGLLAALACADAAVAELAPAATRTAESAPVRVEDEATRLLLQDALEDGYARRLLASLNPPSDDSAERPAVQALFCIDVRSEPLRRHLEAQSPTVETRGFAGFFGVSLDLAPAGNEGDGGSARCPVLLRPSVPLGLRAAGPGVMSKAGKRVASSPAGAFTFVEVLGLAYGAGLVADATSPDRASPDAEATAAFEAGFGDPAARADAAAGILKNTGLADAALHGRLAPLVVLCGHGGRSANNPHAAGLDCGACGGHGGAINARAAAALLNDPAVRDALRGRGVDVPADAHFQPAAHYTSTDEVTLLDLDRLPESHRAGVDALRESLATAGAAVRGERAADLGLDPEDAPAGLWRRLRRRAVDPSQTRPEWALARNAAFVAARRGRTRGVDLNGRAFLHEYDAAADPDGSILTLILSAPMVVASWINLQYFASTVDNDALGCGDKALQHRVGTIGVVLGNGGDLRTGLAKQSVHAADGSWHHEPLRLQVVVEAPEAKIDAVLRDQPSVRDLVDNGWVRLFALPPGDGVAARRVPGSGWEPVA